MKLGFGSQNHRVRQCDAQRVLSRFGTDQFGTNTDRDLGAFCKFTRRDAQPMGRFDGDALCCGVAHLAGQARR